MEIWDHPRLQAEGRFRGLDADMPPPTAPCREDEENRVRSVVSKLIANGESHVPSREAAQLEVSGLGSHVAAKRAGAERREADFCRRATAERHAKKNHSRERVTKGGVEARACVLPEMHKCPRAQWKKAPTRERTRSIRCGVCEGGAVCACSGRTDAR